MSELNKGVLFSFHSLLLIFLTCLFIPSELMNIINIGAINPKHQEQDENSESFLFKRHLSK